MIKINIQTDIYNKRMWNEYISFFGKFKNKYLVNMHDVESNKHCYKYFTFNYVFTLC